MRFKDGSVIAQSRERRSVRPWRRTGSRILAGLITARPKEKGPTEAGPVWMEASLAGGNGNKIDRF